MEKISSKINNSKVNMRSISTLNTMNLWCKWNSNTSTEMSIILSILSINVNFSLITMVILLLTKEGIFE